MLRSMDDIVKQAMAKWPNVPHCYGWLALDARGNWRMRDERVQHLGLAGDKVIFPALLAFINRNLAVDERGCWYFQNGPQRVFLNLEATPFIARTDPVLGLVLQTGETVERIDGAWMTEEGSLLLGVEAKIAQLDDRDGAWLLAVLAIDGQPASDDALLAWLAGGEASVRLAYRGQTTAVARIAAGDVPARFGFVRLPQPPTS